MSAAFAEPDWRDRAACRSEPVDLFYSDSRAATVECRRICAGCPVIGPCLADCLVAEGEFQSVRYRYGFRGGMTVAERGRLVRSLPVAPPDLSDQTRCITEGCSNRRRRTGGRLCEACAKRRYVARVAVEGKRGSARGERNAAAVLTAQQVHEIRAAAADGVPRRDLQKRYGMSKAAIAAVVKGRSWRHVA